MPTANRKGLTDIRRLRRAAAALAACPVMALALVGCSGGSGSDASGGGGVGDGSPTDAVSTPPIVDALAKAPKDDGGDSKGLGTVTLTLDGTVTKSPAESCDIVDMGELDFALHSGDLNVLLPPTPGAIKAGDRPVSVHIPAPESELPYAITIHATGQRTESGDRTTGHIEGQVHQVGNSKEDHPFVIDFDCKLQRISS
jgi:hypothetical protein